MKKIKLIFSVVLISLLAVSCIVDDDNVQEFGAGPYVIGFKNSVANESYFVDEGIVTKGYLVNILGGADGSPTTEDIIVSYQIDPASTATEGQEFDFVSNTGTLTIPAGTSFASFPLNINTGGFDPEAPTTLILKLTTTNSAGAVVSVLNDTLAVTFVGCQADLDEYLYDVTIVRNGNTALRPGEPIYMDAVNVFRTRISGTFTPGQQGTDPTMAGMTFTVVCGAITIPAQGLFQNQFSNQLTDDGSGPVMEDGSFALRFSVSGVSGAFVQTYVRQ